MTWRIRATAVMLGLLIGVPGTGIADALSIGYTSTVNEGSERLMIGAFEQRLKSQGIAYELKKIDPVAGRPPADPTLLLTLGKGAAEAAFDRYPTVPILSLIVRKKTCIALSDRRADDAPFSCMQLEQPPDRLAYFASRLFPGRTEALFIFGEQTGYTLASLKEAFAREKMALRDEDAAIVQDFRKLRLKLPPSGVLVTSPDPTVYKPTALQGLILNAYQAGVPILGFSDAFRRAGAAASLFTTAEQFGHQAAVWVMGWKAGQHRASKILEPTDFEISINPTVMRAMAITVRDPDRLKDDYIRKQRGD